MDSFTNTLWLIVAFVSSGVPIVASVIRGELGLRLYSILSPLLWVFNVAFMLIWAPQLELRLLVFSIWQLIVHVILSLSTGTHAILLSSVSLVVIMSFNMWGSEVFEIAALTVCLEVTTWIVAYFIITIRRAMPNSIR